MDAFAKDTSTIFVWNGNKSKPISHYEDDPLTHIVGKFIDGTQIFALDYAPTDTLINFYRFEQNKWKRVGSYRAIEDSMTFLVGFIDMDNDTKNEIIVRTPPNMNGNTWQDVFRYSADNDSIEYAGNFSTDYEIRKDNKTVEETYEGSWYMTPTKTLYQWHNNKLIRIKHIELELADSDISKDDRIFRYYENPTLDKDTLILKIEVPYTGRKYEDMWKNFFSN